MVGADPSRRGHHRQPRIDSFLGFAMVGRFFIPRVVPHITLAVVKLCEAFWAVCGFRYAPIVAIGAAPFDPHSLPCWTGREIPAYRNLMGIIATIMDSTTGQPIQKFSFGRMPKPWVSFTLETGELVKADRVEVGKPAPGKFAVPVSVWVTPKS